MNKKIMVVANAVAAFFCSQNTYSSIWDEQVPIEVIQVNSESLWGMMKNAGSLLDLVSNVDFWNKLLDEADRKGYSKEDIVQGISKAIEKRNIVNKSESLMYEDIAYLVGESSYMEYEGLGADNSIGDNTNSTRLMPNVHYAIKNRKAIIGFDRVFYTSVCKWIDTGPQQVNDWVEQVKLFSISPVYTPVTPLPVDGAFLTIDFNSDLALFAGNPGAALKYKYSATRLAATARDYLIPQQKAGSYIEEPEYFVHRVLSNGTKVGVRLRWLKDGGLRDNYYDYSWPNTKRAANYPFDGVLPQAWSGSQPVTGPFPGEGGTRKFVVDDLSDLPTGTYLLGYEIRASGRLCPVSGKTERWTAYVPFDEDKDNKPDFFIPGFTKWLPAIFHILQ